jgi:molybdopterin-containing oxidoreductase family iron-sulfur binding subunit
MSGKSTRRGFLRKAAASAGLAAGGCSEALREFMRKRLRAMSRRELREFLAELEKKYTKQYGREVKVHSTPAREGVVFGFGLDLSRCNGNRKCVTACVEENNQSRAPDNGDHANPIHWITVLEMEQEKGVDFAHSEIYFNPKQVPEEGKFYVPVACQQCKNPPCVKVCPVKATWKERDGIIVIDYDWCIGCRCCMSACPYGARHFNWCDPHLPPDQLNPNTHVLGNRPRPRGVVEKCTFCIQRTRAGRYPKCLEACPTGARKFGNLLDPESEIRQLLERKRVFVLKEELNAQPKFFYFYG